MCVFPCEKDIRVALCALFETHLDSPYDGAFLLTFTDSAIKMTIKKKEEEAIKNKSRCTKPTRRASLFDCNVVSFQHFTHLRMSDPTDELTADRLCLRHERPLRGEKQTFTPFPRGKKMFHMINIIINL